MGDKDFATFDYPSLRVKPPDRIEKKIYTCKDRIKLLRNVVHCQLIIALVDQQLDFDLYKAIRDDARKTLLEMTQQCGEYSR